MVPCTHCTLSDIKNACITFRKGKCPTFHCRNKHPYSAPFFSPLYLSPLCLSLLFHLLAISTAQGEDEAEDKQLGNLQQGSINITGCVVEVDQIPGQRQNVLRIYPKSGEPNTIGQPALEVAADTMEELKQWKEAIEEASIKATTMVSPVRDL